MAATDERTARERSYGIAPVGDRLPDAAHPGTVHLQVADLRRSLDYYTHVLGMDVLDQRDDRASLGAAGAARSLVRLAARPGLRPAPARGRFGLYHFAILLPDRASLGRFAAHVLRLGVRPGMADHAVSEALYLRDPDGLGIEVYADRPRSAWSLRGRELVMVTQPLDIGGVVAAGGGEPWAGLPAGTVMGHVHLHVGDLAAAEAFYHATLGFEKTVWSYPGALFFSAGGYHHHVATNIWSPGPAAAEDEARLLEWELLVPTRDDAAAIGRRAAAAGYQATDTGNGWPTADPWGTRVRIAGEEV